MAGVIARGLILPTILLPGPVLAAAPHLAGGGTLDISFIRIGLALILCLAAAVSAVLIIKAKSGRLNLPAMGAITKGAANARIAVLETRRISVHADICLLRCDGIDYLVLSSATQQQVIRETPVAPGTAG